MKEGDRLRDKLIKRHSDIVETKFSKILKKLEDSIDLGFQGFIWGYYIDQELGKLLKYHNIEYWTFTDGEFEESKIWIK